MKIQLYCKFIFQKNNLSGFSMLSSKVIAISANSNNKNVSLDIYSQIDKPGAVIKPFSQMNNIIT